MTEQDVMDACFPANNRGQMLKSLIIAGVGAGVVSFILPQLIVGVVIGLAVCASFVLGYAVAEFGAEKRNCATLAISRIEEPEPVNEVDSLGNMTFLYRRPNQS